MGERFRELEAAAWHVKYMLQRMQVRLAHHLPQRPRSGGRACRLPCPGGAARKNPAWAAQRRS